MHQLFIGDLTKTLTKKLWLQKALNFLLQNVFIYFIYKNSSYLFVQYLAKNALNHLQQELEILYNLQYFSCLL